MIFLVFGGTFDLPEAPYATFQAADRDVRGTVPLRHGSPEETEILMGKS